jgi:hypothetical protein
VSFIRVSWVPPDHVDDDDLVDAVAQAGFPVQGRAGRIYVLHTDGQVTQHDGTRAATKALIDDVGSELIVWLLKGSAVATSVRRLETRVECVLSLEGAPQEEQDEAAQAVSALLDELVDVAIEATLQRPAR